MQHVKFYVGYMKVMLEDFELEYVDIKNNFTDWRAKKMLKEVITGDLGPFQMYKFYSLKCCNIDYPVCYVKLTLLHY